jgi:hypothetical protein
MLQCDVPNVVSVVVSRVVSEGTGLRRLLVLVFRAGYSEHSNSLDAQIAT